MEAAYHDNGLEFQEGFWCLTPTDGFRSQEDAACNLRLALPMKPDVLVLANDVSALRTQSLLKEMGIRMPEDIALFSASQSWLGEISSPTISGIDYNSAKVAECLFDSLNRMPEHLSGNDSLSQLIPSTLNWRESCPGP